MPCREDKSRTCGAGWRNSIFKVVVSTTTAVTKGAVYKSIVGESSIGCYKDAGNRDLKKRLNTRNPRKCFEMAMAAGY